MKRLFIAVAAAALCACGSSSNNSGTGGNGGGGSGGGGTGGGTGGTAGSAGGFVVQPTTCNLTSGSTTETISVAAVFAATASQTFSDVCSVGLNACVTYKNITTLGLSVSRLVLGGGTAPAVAPGTYNVGTDLAGGTVVSAAETKTDASCADVPGTPTATAGTITLTAVGPTISGSYDLTMSDSTKRTGSFSGPSCGASLPSGQSLCDAINGGGNPTGTCSGTPTCQ